MDPLAGFGRQTGVGKEAAIRGDLGPIAVGTNRRYNRRDDSQARPGALPPARRVPDVGLRQP